MQETRTAKCHTGPLYIADIMSAPRSSTVWITPAATGRGLTIATTVGPVEENSSRGRGWGDTRLVTYTAEEQSSSIESSAPAHWGCFQKPAFDVHW